MAGTFDRRRVLGPDVSFPPAYAPLDPTPSSSKQPVNQEPPATFLKTGLISQANGSAYIEVGKVKIACAVYGPRPKQPPFTPQGTLNLEVKFAPFASHPRRAPLRDTEPPHLSHLLTEHLLPALQLHLLPKSTLDVYLLVLESESPSIESVLAAGLTVASSAIADAQIPMNALGVGVVSAEGSEGESQAVGQAVMHPEGKVAREAAGRVTVGCMPALGMLTNVWMTGQLDAEELAEMIEASVASTVDVHKTVEQALHAGVLERCNDMLA